MKKRFLVLLLAVSLLAGCGGKQPSVERPEREETETPWTESDRVYDDTLLTEFTYEKTIGEGDSEIHISYSLPQILDDTPDAENINQLFQWYQQEAEESEYPTFESITWESYWNGSLVSILLTAQPLGQGETNYLPVNYDFAEGRDVPPWEIPEWIGISQEDALKGLRRTAAQEFDSFMAQTLDTCDDCYDDVVGLRAATLSESALNLENTMLYLDDYGVLNASLTIYTLSGGGYHYLTAPVDVAPENQKVREEYYGNVMAEDTRFGLQVTFREADPNDPTHIYLERVEPRVTYPVDGFYGEVRDMVLAELGYFHDTYLVVVDQEGQLFYCNISDAAWRNDGIRMVGPMEEPRNVARLKVEPSESEIYAVTEDGTSLPLYEKTVLMEYEVSEILDDTLWLTEDESVGLTMEMASNDTPFMQWSSEELTAEGFFFFNGVTEKGVHFRGNLQDRDLNNQQVNIICSVPDWWDFSTSVMTLTFLETGETLELTLAQG